MKLIVGLGNIGNEYAKTRHNAGFLLLDYLMRIISGNNAEFKIEKKFEAAVLRLVSELAGLKGEVLLVKPQTYMNESGRAVAKLVHFYRLDPAKDLILLHDDLDIELGRFKIMRKGPRVHNGVNSVEKAIGTGDFWRVRVGIAGEHYDLIKRQGGTMKEDYVLKNFGDAEFAILEGIFGQILNDLSKLS